MNPEIINKYSAPVPRYTSYPTAPHFTPDVGAASYAKWLSALPEHTDLSLYMHIPFCHALCWYCGCCTKAVQRYEPVAAYVASLQKEIESVASRITKPHAVKHIHWGGGSPNALSPDDILLLNTLLRGNFQVSDTAEFAVEIDPRVLSREQVVAFALAGVTRVSLGVQDFDPAVQAAINREQSYETTQRAVEQFRELGINAINIDLVYGLPHQTRESVQETIRQVLKLQPDRIAIFGYAHLPSRFKNQTRIDDAALPDAIERFAQSSRLARILETAGYVRIGLDHFARADDPLAQGQVNRNFQGYTTDSASSLIGLGASAIGRLPEGYVQNEPSAAGYARRIESDGLATVRGRALSEDDRIRGFAIERLMCDMTFPADEISRRFGSAAESVVEEAEALIEMDPDALIERTSDGFRLTPRGRPFVRSIAACFDIYLDQGAALHSKGA